jgi:hypothetical protein
MMPSRGPNARNCGHGSRAGAVRIGPAGLDRRTGLPSAVLREATTLSARSVASFGDITADRRRFSAEFGPPSAAGTAACARRRRHASASGWCETPWIQPDRRSSPAGPGLSAAPAAPERCDCTFRAPSEPGGLMRAQDLSEAQGDLTRARPTAACVVMGRSVAWSALDPGAALSGVSGPLLIPKPHIRFK